MFYLIFRFAIHFTLNKFVEQYKNVFYDRMKNYNSGITSVTKSKQNHLKIIARFKDLMSLKEKRKTCSIVLFLVDFIIVTVYLLFCLKTNQNTVQVFKKSREVD